MKGTVIDAVDAHHITCDYVCSCGPRPMLKAIEARYTRGYMSFESRMACGIGACMACVAKDKKEENLYHTICKEDLYFNRKGGVLMDLHVTLPGLHLKNPIIPASGCFGFRA